MNSDIPYSSLRIKMKNKLVAELRNTLKYQLAVNLIKLDVAKLISQLFCIFTLLRWLVPVFVFKISC